MYTRELGPPYEEGQLTLGRIAQVNALVRFPSGSWHRLDSHRVAQGVRGNLKVSAGSAGSDSVPPEVDSVWVGQFTARR